MSKILPLPELIDASQWEVRDCGKDFEAYVDFDKMEMVIPTTSGKTSEFIRAHEAMHVAISPHPKEIAYPEGIEPRTIRAVEDARINSGLNNVGISTNVDMDKENLGTSNPIENLKSMFSMLGKEPAEAELEAARYLMARRGMKNFKEIMEFSEKEFPEAVEAYKELTEKHFVPHEEKHSLIPFEEVVKVSEELTQRFKFKVVGGESGGEGDKGPGSKGSGSNSMSQTSLAEKFDALDKNGNEKAVAHLPNMTEEEKSELSKIFDSGVLEKQNGKPGTMEIEWMPMTEVFHTKKTPKRVAEEAGVVPRNMHRLATDQRVFSRKIMKNRGAALLIDMSGSMSFTSENVEEILDICPAATIALYSGVGGKGYLKVIVDRKMRVPKGHLPDMPGSNIVDIPALEWLAARREERKIWVSDGYVTGTNSVDSDILLSAKWLRYGAEVVKKANIIRIPNIETLKKSNVLNVYKPKAALAAMGYSAGEKVYWGDDK